MLHTGTGALNTQTDRQTDGQRTDGQTDRLTWTRIQMDQTPCRQKKQVGFKPTNSVK